MFLLATSRRKLSIIAGNLMIFGLCAAYLTGWPENNFPIPNRPDSVGVFMANGVFDAADTNYAPPTFDDFETVIMGRDQTAKDSRRVEAVNYFLDRYGIDFWH